jgi:hypothetical protein
MAQGVEHWLCSNSSPTKKREKIHQFDMDVIALFTKSLWRPEVVMHICNPSTQKTEAGEAQVKPA